MTNQDNETQNTEKQDLADRVDHLEETISKMLPTRRDALKFGGAAALGGAAMSGRASAGTSEVGTIGTSTELVDINAEDISAAAIETESISVTSWEWIDVVKAGADPTGTTPIDSVLSSLKGDNKLLIFPEGDYYLNETFDFDNANNFGFLGVGDATISIDDSFTGDEIIQFGTTDATAGSKLLFKNIDFDLSSQTGTGQAGRVLRMFVSDYGQVENVTVSGERKDELNVSTVRTDCVAEDATISVQNVNLLDGAVSGASNPTGMTAGTNHVGHVVVERSKVADFPDNGFYFSGLGPTGRATLRDCFAKNNDVSNIRLGGAGSHASGCRVVVDSALSNTNALLARDGDASFSRCTIDVSAPVSNSILVSADADSATFEDVNITHNSDSRIVLVDQTTKNTVSFKGLVIDATCDELPPIRVQRPHTSFVDCDITVNGDAVTSEAIRFEAPDCVVRGGEIQCGRWPVHSRNINLDGDRTRVLYADLNATSDEDVRINGVEAFAIKNSGDAYSVRTDSALRPFYNDILHGGPFGGTDIGSLTGGDEGDIARSDGTTGDADGLYLLKANGDWQAIHDATTTITPS